MSIRVPKAIWFATVVLVTLTVLRAFQAPFRVYRAVEGYDDLALPPDYQDKTEFILGRLRFPSPGMGGMRLTVDYPKGDRTFASAIRRLTRINVRSV